MKFKNTPLEGAWVIELDAHKDDRGYFARTFCQKEFKAHGLATNIVQSNVSWSANAGTLRGMHFQKLPMSETKLVRCVRGSLFDVIVDLRSDSPTYLQHFGVELSGENMRMLYVPKGFAHGFITLVDNTEIQYMVSEYYEPSQEFGVRHDDPAFGIKWPVPVTEISEKDRKWPKYDLHRDRYFTMSLMD
jgi:dTDP-4-dehydrorhamnose 3,5-epimerase